MIQADACGRCAADKHADVSTYLEAARYFAEAFAAQAEARTQELQLVAEELTAAEARPALCQHTLSATAPMCPSMPTMEGVKNNKYKPWLRDLSFHVQVEVKSRQKDVAAAQEAQAAIEDEKETAEDKLRLVVHNYEEAVARGKAIAANGIVQVPYRPAPGQLRLRSHAGC